uniref:Uncharacterized protein n=1 Tax=Thermogemmatispora argillosa TaxID=2045280 RepID=A0A455SYQ2_9CHLR|nr:hypothetical protein KTA_10190 [Thermogemmatispora argillosa]
MSQVGLYLIRAYLNGEEASYLPLMILHERAVAWPSLRGLEAQDSYVGRLELFETGLEVYCRVLPL